MADAGDPVPSLGDASALLLRSVSAQLRRLRPRVPARARLTLRPPAAPTVARDVRATTPPVRRRILWRHLLTSAALLVGIAGSTAGLTWWSWQTLQDRQVQLAGEQSLSKNSSDRSLVGDLVRREEKREEKGVLAPREKTGPGSRTLESSGGNRSASAPRSVSVDGRIVAFGIIAAALAAAAGASRLVLRRYRLRAAAAPLIVDLRPSLEPRPEVEVAADPELEPDPEAELEPDPEAELEPAADPHGQAAAVASAEDLPDEAAGNLPDDAAVAGLLVEQRLPEPAEHRPVALAAEPAGPAGTAVSLAENGVVPSAGWPVEQEPVAAGGALALLASLPADSDSYDGVSEDEAARERIFDRRATRRVPYVQPAWIWWAEQNAPVTVQDLSVTGLRCLLGSAPGAAALQAPALGDEVRIFFPVSGSTIKVNTRVQWKEYTPQGTEMGVEFVDLPQADAVVIRQFAAAAD
ncbi:MAG: PilZ domain-containing protein [Mycobacteriales bacterium]